MNKDKNILFALDNSQILGNKIAKKLQMPLSEINAIQFQDGEFLLNAKQTVRNKNVFIIASCFKPVNENIMKLLLFIDSLKRASAKCINLVLTYYPYARQDRKASGRQPIGAKLVADLLEKVGITKLITLDLHNPAIQGFFNAPVDDLRAQYIFAPEIKKLGKFTVVSPDHGGTIRARLLAELISNTIDITIIDKRRTGPNTIEVVNVLGEVKNKNVVILDDIIDTGGTIINAANVLKQKGAKKIFVATSHGLFSKGFEHFENSCIDKVIVTDSIEKVYNIKSSKIHVVSLADLLSSVISLSVENKSISKMYKKIQLSIQKY